MFSLAERSLYVADLDLWIDSMRPRSRCFVSHGHADHARAHDLIVTSPNNARVCRERFRDGRHCEFEEHAFNAPWSLGGHRLTLFSAGHVLGSAQLLIEGESGAFVYTGDFKLEPSYTAEPVEVKRCDVLLMESTYGRPQFVFPPRAEVEAEMVAWARAALEGGAVPIFYAYSLGKAQEAVAILGRAGLPVTAHGAIHSMARVYAEAGIDLPQLDRYDARAFDGTSVLVWPPSGKAVPSAVRGKPVKSAMLTGWSVAPGMLARYGTDTGFALSDHADFPALLRYVELAQPTKVFCNHGDPSFVRELRRRGVDAHPLEAHEQLALF